MIFARNVMLSAQFAVQRAFSYAPVSSIGRFGIVLADKTLKLVVSQFAFARLQRTLVIVFVSIKVYF